MLFYHVFIKFYNNVRFKGYQNAIKILSIIIIYCSHAWMHLCHIMWCYIAILYSLENMKWDLVGTYISILRASYRNWLYDIYETMVRLHATRMGYYTSERAVYSTGLSRKRKGINYEDVYLSRIFRPFFLFHMLFIPFRVYFGAELFSLKLTRLSWMIKSTLFFVLIMSLWWCHNVGARELSVIHILQCMRETMLIRSRPFVSLFDNWGDSTGIMNVRLENEKCIPIKPVLWKSGYLHIHERLWKMEESIRNHYYLHSHIVRILDFRRLLLSLYHFVSYIYLVAAWIIFPQ